VVLCESETFGRERIDVGGGDFAAVAAEVGVADVVADYYDYVRAFGAVGSSYGSDCSDGAEADGL